MYRDLKGSLFWMRQAASHDYAPGQKLVGKPPFTDPEPITNPVTSDQKDRHVEPQSPRVDKVTDSSHPRGSGEAEITHSSSNAGGYAKCFLDSTPTDKGAVTDDVLDNVVLACIRKNEEPLSDTEIAKVKFDSTIYYGDMRTFSGLGLIISLYNGSSYDLTALDIVLTDKKTKEQRTYRYNEFYPYIRIGLMSKRPAPQYRRFIKALSQAEYVFPLELPNVRQEDFFKKFDVAILPASGIGGAQAQARAHVTARRPMTPEEQEEDELLYGPRKVKTEPEPQQVTQSEDSKFNYCEAFAERADRSSKCPPDATPTLPKPGTPPKEAAKPNPPVKDESSTWLEDNYGQYFCYVDQVAGIKIAPDNSATSGQMKLPEWEMKFIIKVAPAAQQTDTRREICLDTMNHYKEYFEKGISVKEWRPVGPKQHIEDRQWIGQHCFISEEMTVTYPGKTIPPGGSGWPPLRQFEVYRGYGGPQFYGGEEPATRSTSSLINLFGRVSTTTMVLSLSMDTARKSSLQSSPPSRTLRSHDALCFYLGRQIKRAYQRAVLLFASHKSQWPTIGQNDAGRGRNHSQSHV
jgi:hypothetical protein